MLPQLTIQLRHPAGNGAPEPQLPSCKLVMAGTAGTQPVPTVRAPSDTPRYVF